MTLAGEPVELTTTEYALLYELSVHATRVLTPSVLLQRVWRSEKVSEAWLVRDVVKRTRRKLGDDAHNPLSSPGAPGTHTIYTTGKKPVTYPQQ